MTDTIPRLGYLEASILLRSAVRSADVRRGVRAHYRDGVAEHREGKAEGRIELAWSGCGFDYTRAESAAISRALRTLKAKRLMGSRNDCSEGPRATVVWLTAEGKRVAYDLARRSWGESVNTRAVGSLLAPTADRDPETLTKQQTQNVNARSAA